VRIILSRSPKFPRRQHAAFVCLALAAGCSDPLPGDFEVLSAIVYGAVSTAAGTPAVGARVVALAHSPECTSPAVGGSDVSTTDRTGRYRAAVTQISRLGPMCTEVLVLPGTSGVTDTLRVPGPVLDFRLARRPAALDSGRVDVRLP
jgi:hypothetical protein